MATWVIGDIHGCWQTLERLLDRIGWKPGADRLWLVGDLVNRGPASLQVLRWAYRHRDHLVCVLGNHDLHLLARAAGLRRPRTGDTLDTIMSSPDRDRLLEWLRRRPLLHASGGRTLVHAGLMPDWGADEALSLAAGVASRMADDDGLPALYAHRKEVWRPGLTGDRRLAAALAVFTLLRVVGADGLPRLGFSAAPAAAPAGAQPWFLASRAAAAGGQVIFGHWATLGRHDSGAFRCLDSGCVWGGELSALRLDDGLSVAVPAVPGEAVPWSFTSRAEEEATDG